MRLLLTFAALLVVGTTGMTVAWEEAAFAGIGAVVTGLIVLFGTAVALTSAVCLGRIVYRISDRPALPRANE